MRRKRDRYRNGSLDLLLLRTSIVQKTKTNTSFETEGSYKGEYKNKFFEMQSGVVDGYVTTFRSNLLLSSSEPIPYLPS